MKQKKAEWIFSFGTDLIDTTLYEYKKGRIKLLIQTEEYPDGLQLHFNKNGKIRMFDENDREIYLKIKK